MTMNAAARTMISQNHQRFARDFIPFKPFLEGHAPSCPQKGADTAAPSINKNALRAEFSRIYLRGVELEIGNANVEETDAVGETEAAGEAVGLGDGETVGVGVGGGGIMFSQ